MLAISRTKLNVNPQTGDMWVVQCPYHEFWSQLFADVPQRRYLACTNTDNNIRGIILSLLGDIWSLDLHVRLITNTVSYKGHKLKRHVFTVGQLCHWHYKPWHLGFHHQIEACRVVSQETGTDVFQKFVFSSPLPGVFGESCSVTASENISWFCSFITKGFLKINK